MLQKNSKNIHFYGFILRKPAADFTVTLYIIKNKLFLPDEGDIQMILKIDDIINLKKIILKEYNTKLHWHDTCGGQYFSFDSKINGIENFINKYLSQYNLHAKFSADGLSFTVE